MASETAARRLRDALRSLLVAHGALAETRRPCGTPLPIPHAYALLELLHATRPLTVTELAAKLSIDRSNVSRLCARMEEAGELRREPSPDDARAWALRLTPRGRKLAKSVDDASAQHFLALCKRLGASVHDVTAALDQLARAMTEPQEPR